MQIINKDKGFTVFAYVRLRLSLMANPNVTRNAKSCNYHIHTVEVVGSNPAVPTIKSTTYEGLASRFGAIGAKV